MALNKGMAIGIALNVAWCIVWLVCTWGINVGGMGNYVDLLMDWLVCFDMVMDVVAYIFVDNEVHHVEVVLSPCGGDM